MGCAVTPMLPLCCSATPVAQDHFAVCDASTLVAPDDFVCSELFGEGYNVLQYKLDARRAERHRWCYFSAMQKVPPALPPALPPESLEYKPQPEPAPSPWPCHQR